MSSVKLQAEELKTVVKLRVEPLNHRKGKIDNWGKLLIVTGRFDKFGEVEFNPVHVKADRVMN
jgi:hypothetical protein